jgi:hypothetical protein
MKTRLKSFHISKIIMSFFQFAKQEMDALLLELLAKNEYLEYPEQVVHRYLSRTVGEKKGQDASSVKFGDTYLRDYLKNYILKNKAGGKIAMVLMTSDAGNNQFNAHYFITLPKRAKKVKKQLLSKGYSEPPEWLAKCY